MGILSRKGLTLVELMIVIVILGIMASVIGPDYKSYMLRKRLQGAAFAVMSDLMLARAQAISMNRDVGVSFPGSPLGQYIYDDTGTALIKNIRTNSGYYDVTLSADNDPIFSSRGIAKNAAGTYLNGIVATVTFSNPAGSKTVTVNIAGRVAIN